MAELQKPDPPTFTFANGLEVFHCPNCGWTPKTPDSPPAKCGCYHAWWYWWRKTNGGSP
jgi:hypothetical protein